MEIEKQADQNFLDEEDNIKVTIENLQRDIRRDLVRQYIYYRKLKKMTQEQVAKKVGISRTNVTRFEGGEYNPSLEMMVKLAKALDMNLSIQLKE